MAACSGPLVGPPPATSVAVEPSGTPAETPEQVVSLDNEGQTIEMNVGERFLLQLGEEYDWTATPADQTILSRVLGVTVVRGAQGLSEAHKAGTTTLNASGDPVCLQSDPPCAQPSRQFEIEVIVQ